MKQKTPLKEGMKLYAVPFVRNYKPGTAIVEKTGRKWAQVHILENCYKTILFDVKTWEQKPTGYGYNKTFALWESKEEYEDSLEFAAWKREFLSYKAELLPREFWEEVRKLYESKDWNNQ